MNMRLLTGVLLLVGGARTIEAQELAQRITAAHASRVTFTFDAKPGVCGDGESIDFGTVHRYNGQVRECNEGPVRVTLDLDQGRVLRLKTTVGDAASASATDLGMVTPAAASDWLLSFAARGEGSASENAVMPAVLAKDVVIWPRLATMAKDHELRQGTRRQAIFWLGQQAADQAVGTLDDLVNDSDDVEVQKAALFALSQQRSDHAIDVLVRVAKTNRHRELRRNAFFWLGQSEDPRGIALFEEVLAGR